MKPIYFYSNTHLGDIHLGRSYVEWFVNNFNAKFYYTHNYSPNVLLDIENLEYVPDLWQMVPQSSGIIENDECIYLNTWIGADGTAMGVNFEAIYFIFTKYFNYLIKKGYACKQNSLPKLLPYINFNSSKVEKAKINEWFKEKQITKKIFIANNYVESGQSSNFNMNLLIETLAKQFSNIEFYLTNKESPLIKNYNNLFYIEDIIQKPKFNLNEVSYFSTFCDVIIGRGSGPFSFCEVKENLNKIWISITFPHLEKDVFNGLNKFENQGQYYHTMDTNLIMDIIFDFTRNI